MAPKKRDPLVRSCTTCGKKMELGGRGRPPLKTKYCSRRCLAMGRLRIPTIHPLQHDQVVYMAGLFDGEGCIVMYDRGYGGRPQLRITISNTHTGVIDWLTVTCGGSVVVHTWDKPEHQHYKTGHTWQLYGQNAVSLLEQMLPFLIIKRERALEAIASQEVQRVA